ncbi:hypothetical protein EV359DRAFT_86800 [Lentinula novae-zelandiae]|nr:hypothetical protein EV359DRAFT_86800 [Lentinula novae-zelandiae]
MSNLTWCEPVVSQPLDAYQISSNEPLPPASTQTVAAIAACLGLPLTKPNYQPTGSSVAAFLASSCENAVSPMRDSPSHPMLVSANRRPQDSTGYTTLTRLDSASSRAQEILGSRTLTAVPSGACSDSASGRNTGNATTLLAGGLLKEKGAGAASAEAANGVVSAQGAHTAADPTATAAGNGSMTVSQSGPIPLTPSSANNAVPPVCLPLIKKKRSEMGQAEKAAARKAALARAEKLSLDLERLLVNQNELKEKVAEENNITVACISTLLNQVSACTGSKKASDYNILVFLKTQELNALCPAGAKFSLKDIHTAVKEEEELMETLKEPELMAEYREFFDSEKAEQKVAAVQADVLVDATGAAVFGIVARGSFESSVISSFFGRGPADAFLRKYFGKGIQEVTDLFEAYVCTAEKMGTRKLYQSEMISEVVRLITQGLHEFYFIFYYSTYQTTIGEVTGISSLTMSYANFNKLILIPYKVDVTGWPEDVDQIYPQKLSAEAVRTLHDIWTNGTAHWIRLGAQEYRAWLHVLSSEGKLDPKPRQHRSDMCGQHQKRKCIKARGSGDDSDSENHDEEDLPPIPPKKKTKPSNRQSREGQALATTEPDGGGGSKKSLSSKRKATEGSGKSTRGRVAKGRHGKQGKSKGLSSDDNDYETGADDQASQDE